MIFGVDEDLQGIENQVLVFPNPTSDLLNVVSLSTIENMELYSSIGQLINDFTIDKQADNHHLIIESMGLPACNYFLRLQTTAGLLTRRVIVLK